MLLNDFHLENIKPLMRYAMMNSLLKYNYYFRTTFDLPNIFKIAKKFETLVIKIILKNLYIANVNSYVLI